METLEKELFEGVLDVSKIEKAKIYDSCKLCAPCDSGKGYSSYIDSCKLCAPCDSGK